MCQLYSAEFVLCMIREFHLCQDRGNRSGIDSGRADLGNGFVTALHIPAYD
jgi:hypothetical protein